MTVLIVKSGVKDHLRGNNVSADFYEVLDEAVGDLLDDGIRECVLADSA